MLPRSGRGEATLFYKEKYEVFILIQTGNRIINELIVKSSLTKSKTKKEIDYLTLIDSYCEEESIYVKNIFEIIKKL